MYNMCRCVLLSIRWTLVRDMTRVDRDNFHSAETATVTLNLIAIITTVKKYSTRKINAVVDMKAETSNRATVL